MGESLEGTRSNDGLPFDGTTRRVPPETAPAVGVSPSDAFVRGSRSTPLPLDSSGRPWLCDGVAGRRIAYAIGPDERRRADRNRYSDPPIIPAVVLELLLPGLIAFAFVMIAAYAGTLRALEVYFDPSRSSVFLSDDHEPPR